MTRRPLRQCVAPGCYRLVRDQPRCPQHQQQRTRQPDNRPNSHRRGYSRRWRKATKAWLAKPENALCIYCKQRGIIRASECVDHFIPHNGVTM